MRDHPRWCARNYRCTATRYGGEHLSSPIVFPAGHDGVSTVVSLAQRPTDCTPLVEFRVRVRLTASEETEQAHQIRQLLLRLKRALGEVSR